MKVVIVNGVPQSGKNQFVEYCLKKLGIFGAEISTVDLIKKIAKMCGWNGTKDARSRLFLSNLKDLLTEWDDIPYREVERFLQRKEFEYEQYDLNHDNAILFVYCREPWEIQKFKERLNATTLLLRRAEVENTTQSNHADAEVFNYNYDYVLLNNGSLEDLEARAHEFVELLKN